MIESGVDDFDVSIIMTYPGSPYYDHAEPRAMPGEWTYTYPKPGDKLHETEIDYIEVSDYYKGDPGGGYKAYVHTDELSSQSLVEMRDWVENDVRIRLGIPFNDARPFARYEHSMSQSSELQDTILRSSGFALGQGE